MPTICVVVSAYNKGRGIAEALDSLLGQSVPADEVVAVDDGSTDDAVEQIKLGR